MRSSVASSLITTVNVVRPSSPRSRTLHKSLPNPQRPHTQVAKNGSVNLPNRYKD